MTTKSNRDIRLSCDANFKQKPINKVAFSLKDNVFFPCVYVFRLISPLFGLALSSIDAFWERLQPSVTRKSR